MPIRLDNLSEPTAVVSYSPKFFDSKLTGAGKKVGLLNDARNPIHIDKGQNTTNNNINCHKHKFTNGNVEVSMIPLYILTTDAWENMREIAVPDINDLTLIGTGKNQHIYASMDVHSILLEEISSNSKGGASTKILTACYQVFIWRIDDNLAIGTPAENLYHVTSATGNHHGVYIDYTCNPLRTMMSLAEDLRKDGYTVDDKDIFAFIQSYDLYSAVSKKSEQWQTSIDKVLDAYFQQVKKYPNGTSSLNEVARVLHRIEDYNVPLDLYRHIYTSLIANFKPDDATVLCKQNLNLLLSDTLNNLNGNKALLSSIPSPQAPIALDPRFSKEQMKAISTSEPLALVQAGAGTGKSTVVLARIKYMIDCGIDPADIMVLSFTNAAADHITEKNPTIHSMTIARMIHTIYTTNFHGHELSSIDTMMNAIDIYFPNDDFAYAFKNKLYGIWKNDRDSFTRMNNFVERHYDEVMKVLDTIRQTSLEMEIIICYQKIETLQEPPEVQSKYLIIDEVQDNSIFEFVYTLKYIDKHKESLFMVGDCSQTLYEFRASNPKALNVLEGSGVFATYQLQTNYRSNQEILEFANVALADIEANQYAHIQLQANSLAPITAQSFQDKVTLHYERLNKISDFNDAMASVFVTDVYKFVDAKIAAGEQVAFLAYTRNHVYKMEALLKKHYPNLTIANLMPDKMFNSTVMSMFIKKYWNQVKFVPTKSIMVVIVQEIIHYLDFLVYNKNKSLSQIQAMLSEWVSENRNTVASWQNQYQNGIITQQQFMDNVRDNMLQFEIRRNAVRQSLLSARNQENKQTNAMANANLILSTIHSAKGLEFENTVVIYQAKNDMDEEKKRMYYVALTRAMKSEFVLAYDTVVNAKIEADYQSIVNMLNKRAAKSAAPIQGAAGVTVIEEKDDADDKAADLLTLPVDECNTDEDETD